MLRLANWFTLGESRASFQFEGEEKQTNRTQCHFAIWFASVACFCGQYRSFSKYRSLHRPTFETLTDKLAGIIQFWEKTEGQSAIMRSAVVSFSFAYLHPLSDGNGRIHRFLFNDLLRRTGETTAPIILPLSGVIIENSQEKQAYAKILEQVSTPLMNVLSRHYCFTEESQQYADDIWSNFQLTNASTAETIWRYPHLTEHVNYFARLVEKTISHYMRQEYYYLYRHEQAQQAVKNIIEMPVHYADRIIQSVLDNKGVLTNKLAKEYPFLTKPTIWENMVLVIQEAFGEIK